jgi:hypothetical protein
MSFPVRRQRPAQVLCRIALRPPRCNGIAKNPAAILQCPFRSLEFGSRFNSSQARQISTALNFAIGRRPIHGKRYSSNGRMTFSKWLSFQPLATILKPLSRHRLERRICIGKRKINLSTVFAGQNVGVKEVSDKIWLVSFMRYDLGFFDQEEGTVTSLDNPFGANVLPMCSV